MATTALKTCPRGGFQGRRPTLLVNARLLGPSIARYWPLGSLGVQAPQLPSAHSGHTPRNGHCPYCRRRPRGFRLLITKTGPPLISRLYHMTAELQLTAEPESNLCLDSFVDVAQPERSVTVTNYKRLDHHMGQARPQPTLCVNYHPRASLSVIQRRGSLSPALGSFRSADPFMLSSTNFNTAWNCCQREPFESLPKLHSTANGD